MRPRAQDGVASVELLGFLPLLLLSALAAWQILLVAFCAVSAENAARAGSRVEGRRGDGAEAAIDSLPSYLQDDARVEIDGTRVKVTVPVPIVFPELNAGDIELTRGAELPGD